MNEFASLLASQLRADLGTLPQRARRHFSAADRAARSGTIGELRAAARRRVPRVVFDYVDGASGDEVTAAANLAALRAIELHPRVLAGVSEVDPVDNWVVSSLPGFEGKKLPSVAQGTADFGGLQDEAEQQATEQANAESAGLTGELKEILGSQVFDVRVSSRLTTSPACIVANEPDLDINLAHRLRGTGLPRQAVLEINPQHPLVRRLNTQPPDPRLADWAQVLYNQAVLTLGAKVEDPAGFITRLNALLVELTGAAAE